MNHIIWGMIGHLNCFIRDNVYMFIVMRVIQVDKHLMEYVKTGMNSYYYLF